MAYLWWLPDSYKVKTDVWQRVIPFFATFIISVKSIAAYLQVKWYKSS